MGDPEARREFQRETTVVTDAGCLAEHIAGAFPYFRVFEPRSFISPSSYCGMGIATSTVPVAKVEDLVAIEDQDPVEPSSVFHPSNTTLTVAPANAAHL